MAVYKVPQDVEAEDKLVGPFGFRQFVYLLIGGGFGGLTFLLFRAPIPIPFFSILTIPVIVLAVVLALPLKKDQPMEIYLAAIIRFMLKPKRRLWIQDGSSAGVIIDAPRFVKIAAGKGISQEDALGQLSYLSRIVDTRGWAAKGVDVPVETTINTSVASALADTEDIMDDNAGLARSFDNLIAKQKQASRDAAMQRMHELGGAGMGPGAAGQVLSQPAADVATVQPAAPTPTYSAATAGPAPGTGRPAAPSQLMDESKQRDMWAGADGDHRPGEKPRFNPYPAMHQQILTPLDRMRTNTFRAPEAGAVAPAEGGGIQVAPQPPAPAQSAAPAEDSDNKSMTAPVSPDIMRLANNNDLSVQAIANEAHRLAENSNGEVVVRLH